jgi:hypothetical protein
VSLQTLARASILGAFVALLLVISASAAEPSKIAIDTDGKVTDYLGNPSPVRRSNWFGRRRCLLPISHAGLK